MKEKYIVPDLIVENFTLSESIAVNCNVEETQTQIDFGNFNQEYLDRRGSACQYPSDGDETYCYTNGSIQIFLS